MDKINKIVDKIISDCSKTDEFKEDLGRMKEKDEIIKQLVKIPESKVTVSRNDIVSSILSGAEIIKKQGMHIPKRTNKK